MNSEGLEEQRQKVVDQLEAIKPFQGLSFDLEAILDFKFIKFRFGRIPRNIIPSLKIIFTRILTPCSANVFLMMSIYGVCISVPSQRRSRSMRSTLPCILSGSTFPKKFHGSPEQIYHDLMEDLDQVNRSLEENKVRAQEPLTACAARLLGARDRLASHSQNFDVRRPRPAQKRKGKCSISSAAG